MREKRLRVIRVGGGGDERECYTRCVHGDDRCVESVMKEATGVWWWAWKGW